MPEQEYTHLQFSNDKAEEIAFKLYGIEGKATPLPGELDMNFRIKTHDKSYILKISRPGTDETYIDFQQAILQHVSSQQTPINSPILFEDIHGKRLSHIKDENKLERKVRLYSWIDGRLWSSVNPVSDKLLFALGMKAGTLTGILASFDHPFAHRKFEWDVSQAIWTTEHLHLFKDDDRKIADYFLKRFRNILPQLNKQRKSVVHNDANDNNVIVSENLSQPDVNAIIDFGDAIHTATINDLAVTLAYACMHKPDPLKAGISLIKGYHLAFPLKEEELELLYVLMAARLIISTTKSAINKQKEPDNEYLLISEKPAWFLLRKWFEINETFATACFRHACGFNAIKSYNAFREWAEKNKIDTDSLFPTHHIENTIDLDLSVSSIWLGSREQYEDPENFEKKLQNFKKDHPQSIPAGGYMEVRPFYSTEQYQKEGNSGPEYRTVHLGVDFWLEEGTPVHAPFNGKILSLHNNGEDKDYGPTLILEHEFGSYKFFTLYGHLGMPTFSISKAGGAVKKGDLIGIIGGHHENGGWAPHLHFQIMLDLLGNDKNFPGVAIPDEKDVWKQLCPDPALILSLPASVLSKEENESVLKFRNEHLGESLSLSYEEPLHMVRGDGAFLINMNGRRYLDTVNNVAHVGHEHPEVVAAGQAQMAVLNTNTRYLHKNINAFAKELLATFPPELSVVHFVNSGSEANELALRMAKAFTGQEDIIALEAGYHGNTGACIDISSYKFDGKGGKGAPEHTHIVPLPDSFRGIHRGNDSGLEYASHLREKINHINKLGRKPAAFICESIISCGGQIELPVKFLKKAYEYTREAGGVCIADEVQVGCGRVGSAFWGFQLHEVIPDIVTIGKPIGNGHPLAAVVCTPELALAFANGMEYFNTFGGNPVSCAIGLEVLNVIQSEKLQENAFITGKYLKDQLWQLQKQFPLIGDVRGQGLFLGFELTSKDLEPLKKQAAYLANRMKELGILMSTDGPDLNVLKIKPPMVFSRQNADELIQRLYQVLEEDYMQLGYE